MNGKSFRMSYSRQKEEGGESSSEERETIPQGVSNESYGVAQETSESAKFAAEQAAFATQQISSSSVG